MAVRNSQAVKQSEIFDYTPSIAPPPCELPMVVKLDLTRHVNSVPQALRDDLRPHDMDKVILEPGRRNVIVVSGIPSMNGFDEHTVLAIVKRHFPGATLA